ncbi:outer membrane precursor Lom [Escherichia coli]|uniref:Outer membrane Lom n=29 Tax=Escherichia coli TaxID=562 RepID=A0A377DTS2_ECOLX|nr:outer membrane precursor Lom [Escherichia coli]
MNISNSQVNRLRHFVRAGLRSLFRPEPQTAVEWADANYYLPKESAYQEGRWETLPFQRAIMNAMGSDYIREVNVVKSARVGYAGDKNRQLTRYSDTRWHEDSVRNRWFSVMAGPSVRVNEWFSAYAMAGMAYSRVSTFSGDYLRVTDNKGKTHDVLTGSDDGRHSNTSLAWGAGVQFNPTESVAIDIAYEGSGSGDWRADGFIVGVGYKF